ncbi:MAG TPA: sulfatase-like hydrolase/transferase [Vicinamibacteria bacterium]
MAARLSRCAAAALVLFAACRRGAVGPYSDASVVLVSIDTLRADHLPAYGYRAVSTPAIDAIAREGIVFEDVYSHCPLTLPAHASMLTGLMPPRHGVRDNMGFHLDPSRRTLAARFHAAGADTGAAVSAYVLRRATGIASGFDWYDDAIETDTTSEALAEQQRDGAAAVESLARWIEARGGRRFFAFLHLYEPHAPYTPPPAHRGYANPYDGEIAYADELVGRFVARVRAAGLLDRVILAVTSDHGEGLGDHGEKEHGFFVYRESVRVPLVIRLPGAARAGGRVAGVIAQVDLPATLLDLAGLAFDGMDGVSQRAALAAGRARSRPVYSETLFPRYHFGWSELTAATEERLRYIRAPRPEVYDVRADPGETRNLIGERASAAATMSAWLDSVAGGAPPAPAPVPADVREKLAALGYVGEARLLPPPAGPLADPKDEVDAYEAYRGVGSLRQQGKDAEALAVLERLLAESPGMLDARETLGSTLLRLGRETEALAALDAVVAADPQRASTHLALARIHALRGRRELAERHAAQAASADPGQAYDILAGLMIDAGRVDEAVTFARRALEADPERVTARYVLGLAAQRAGRCEDALAEYGRAEEAHRRQRGLVVRGLHARTGDCLARLGREAEAEREFRAEIEESPYSAEGRVGLAILYRSQGRDEPARQVLAGVVTANPRAGANEYWTVVRTLSGLGDAEAARSWAARARARYPSDSRFR